MSNYPDGVTDAHPHFNPSEGSLHLTCGNDEAPVVPFHAVRTELDELTEWFQMKPRALDQIEGRLALLSDYLTTLKLDSDYECPFEGTVDVDISEEAEWDCPVCGGSRTSDTLPEDRDPDYEHDRDR
jgi:hypothetical protein